MVYRVVFHRDGREVGTLYWSGSLEETKRLARRIASERDADRFEVSVLADKAAETYIERRPFGEDVTNH